MTKKLPSVNGIIVDMDNTLYDWIGYFVPSIRAMIKEAAALLGADEEQIKADLRTVHTARANTEYPFALLETQTVADCLPALTRRERYDFLKPAFDAFRRVRTETLHLYPGVRETLQAIKATGCRLFGHTEATEVNVASRVRSLGLNEELEAVYALHFNGMSHPLGSEYEEAGDRSGVRVIPSRARKPDPTLIKTILAETGIEASRCLYVGDSLDRDVSMAKRAGILAAWARYGTQRDPEEWDYLVEISHWDASAVAVAEKNPVINEDILPDIIIDSFAELLHQFVFSAG